MSLTIKQRSVGNIFAVLIAIAYGLVIVALVYRHMSSGSGDIGAYVHFFEDFGVWEYYNDFSVRGEGIFRYSIFFLKTNFDKEAVQVLSYIAFLTSSITLYIYAYSIRSLRYLVVSAPLFLMVFLTPRVMDLYASGIRSGIAFTILLLGLLSRRAVLSYSLFALASFIHLSMIPIVALYLFFYLLRSINTRPSLLSTYLLLIAFAIFLTIAAWILNFNSTNVASSFYYNFLLFYLCAILIFSSKSAVLDIYGFISIGLMLILLFGIVVDLSFVRYTGNAIILYLFFLIKSGSVNTIKIFSICYIPFVILTLAYFLTN